MKGEVCFVEIKCPKCGYVQCFDESGNNDESERSTTSTVASKEDTSDIVTEVTKEEKGNTNT